MTKNPELIKLGKNIAKHRKLKGLSQDELSYEAELGRRTINRIEVGETDSRFTTIYKIAKTLKVELSDLVHDID